MDTQMSNNVNLEPKGGCHVYGPGDHVAHHTGSEESSCFYFAPFALDDMAAEMKAAGKSLTVRMARIEVQDKDDILHQHDGLTLVEITAGFGMFKTLEGDIQVRTGDKIVVPPHTPHLSIAAPGTVMHEQVVYIGAHDDRQASRPAFHAPLDAHKIG
jgi:homogentisate 1,2-dioxygenase